MASEKLPPVGVKAVVEDIEQFKRDAKALNTALSDMETGTTKVTQAQKGLGTALGPLPPSLKRVQASAKALSGEAGGLDGRITALSSSMAGNAAGAGTMVEGLMGVVGTVGLVVGVVGGLAVAFSMSMAALERVEPLWQARDAYAALSGQVGDTADAMIRDTVRASQFTVSEYKVITMANQELLAGYDQLAKAFPQLMELAATTAAATGQTIEGAFTRIVTALRTGNQAALEAVGVFLELDAAMEAYVEGTPRDVEDLSDLERQLIALGVAAEDIPGYIESMGGASESALAQIRELKTEIGYLKDEMLAAIATGFLGFLQSIGIGDAGGFVREATGVLSTINQVKVLWREVAVLGAEGKLTPKQQGLLDAARAEYGVGIEYAGREAEYRDVLLNILGRAPAAAAGGPETTLEEDLAAATARSAKEARAATRTDLEKDIAAKALRLAPYLTFEETEASRERMLRDMEAYLELWPDVTGPRAQYELAVMEQGWKDYDAAIRGANKSTELSVSKLKEMNKYLLYTAGGGVGAWAQAFAVEHGGQSPLQKYARHEDPLQAALIDKQWGDQFAAREGRAPSQAEWEGHWYEQWAPLEQYPGGPIKKAVGDVAAEIDKMLAEDNLGGLDDVFHDAYMKSKALVPEFEAVKTEAEILADFTTETWTPSIEANAATVDESTAALERFNVMLGGLVPPTAPETEEDAAKELERFNVLLGGAVLPPSSQDTAAAEALARAIATGRIPHMATGGLMRGAGLAMLHANELVLPLNKLVDMTNMRLGGGGGGLSIQQLNIPVTIAGDAGPGVAAAVQAGVTRAIRGRGGTELIRAGRRLGL